MTPDEIETAAAQLVEARQERRPLATLQPAPGSVADAFAIQAATARRLGPTGAWKVGGPAPDAPRTRAPIAAGLVRPSPCRWPAGELMRIGIEAEIAFRLGAPLEVGASVDDIRRAISGIHAAIEVVDSRFGTWPTPEPLWALADNQNNGGLILDPSGQPYDGRDPSRAEVTITVDGREVFAREGVNSGGSPFDMLVWLAGHLAEAGEPLAPGHVVTTGSLNGILFVEPGAAVVATVAGIGRVEASFPA